MKKETWVTFNDKYMGGVDRWLNYEKLGPLLKSGKLVERKRTEVMSAPLGKLLRDRGVAHVDLLMLDIEGAERAVLETLDFGLVSVGALFIENGLRNGIPEYLASQGFEHVGDVLWDAVFLSRSYRVRALRWLCDKKQARRPQGFWQRIQSWMGRGDCPSGAPSIDVVRHRFEQHVQAAPVRKKLCSCMAGVKKGWLSKESQQICVKFCDVSGSG